MRASRSTSLILSCLLFLSLAPLGFGEGSGPAARRLPAELTGRWSGTLLVPRPAESGGGEQKETFTLRILPEGFGLVDFPDRNMFGFPASPLDYEGGRLRFGLGHGASALDFDGALRSGASDMGGSVSQGRVEGTWSLSRDPEPKGYGSALEIPAKGGPLRGSLVTPASPRPLPLVILVAGSGQTDRDGNNYQIPGRNDSLRLLSAALAERGLASFRYDRRGVGESLALAPSESTLRFDDEIGDLRTILSVLGADPRFSRIVLVGHSQGALVAASLLASAEGLPEGMRSRLSLVVLASGAASARDAFEKAIAQAPADQREIGKEILAVILAGKLWPDPPPYYADYFRPSFQPYLSGWLKRSLKELLPLTKVPLLLVQGDRDMQVELGDFLGLAQARPDAAAAVIPDMNHVLKSVPDAVEENFASFSRPDFPVAQGLVDAIVDFALGAALPADLPRVDGGILPSSGGGLLPSSGQSATAP